MLGPDGKRCKKCSPLVIDLLDGDESDNGQNTPGGGDAKTSMARQHSSESSAGAT